MTLIRLFPPVSLFIVNIDKQGHKLVSWILQINIKRVATRTMLDLSFEILDCWQHWFLIHIINVSCIHLLNAFEGFSLSKWKRDEKVPIGVRLPVWAKQLLLEHLDIAQFMNTIPCKRDTGIFFHQNGTLSSRYQSQSKFYSFKSDNIW